MPIQHTSASSGRPPRAPLLTISCGFVSYIHTILGFTAFGSALVIALCLHYERVVKNGVAGYPDEWWPSVSATIGDWPQERSVMAIVIAIMSGPRFALVLLSALLVSLSSPQSNHARVLALGGCLRTLACGGWVYCTSTDFPMAHDVSMITYLLLTPAWMYITWGSLAPQPNKKTLPSSYSNRSSDVLAEKARKNRKTSAILFFASIPFMCIFYYRHKSMKIPGAYTIYSFFEWNLIIQDLLFDLWSVYDLCRLEIHVVEAAEPDSVPKLGGSWWQGGVGRAIKDGAWSTAPEELELNGTRLTEKEEVDQLLAVNGEETSARNDHAAAVKPSGPIRTALSAVSEVYLAFVWWSSLTALHPSIFFFSVYNLSIGGHEILLVSQVFALAFTLLPPFRNCLLDPLRLIKPSSGEWIVSMWAVILFCIGSWWVPRPLFRLLVTAIANMFSSVLHTVEWGQAWQESKVAFHRKVAIWITGLLLSSLAKYANHSNNPLWPFMNSSNGGHHTLGLSLAVVCLAEILTRPHTPVAPHRSRVQQSKWAEAAAALGLGAILFSLHMFLTDSGTMIAWGWTGYPIKGPMAVPHGWIILTTALLSTGISIAQPDLSQSYLLIPLLASSNYICLAFSDWTSFAGAVGIAAFLPPLVFPLAESAMQHHPIRVLLWSWLVADLMTFFQVLTVAYAFVPGGMPFRERTWVMLLLQIVLLGIGLYNAVGREKKTASDAAAGSRVRVSVLVRRTLYAVMALMAVSSWTVAKVRTIDTSKIKPYHADDGSRVFTAGIQTIHFGLDQLFYDSSRRMSDLYADLQLDVFGLLESDLHRSVFGNRDLTQWLAQELGMYADIGPGPDKHTWGAAVFSKFPILKSTHHLMPSPEGELAPAIHAVLDIYGVPVNVWVSHNGQEETPLDRQLQTEFIAAHASATYPDPFVFLGYVVTKPWAFRPAPYQILFEDGKLLDVEILDRDRWCQYIGFRALSRVAYARVSRYTLTDTELQTVKFRVPDLAAGEDPIDPDENDSPRLVNDYMVPEAWHYPTSYIAPTAKVYAQYKYSPWLYPRYYLPDEKET